MKCYCGGKTKLVYSGDYRDGAYGNTKQGKIYECHKCRVQMLGSFQTTGFYESGIYRESLKEIEWDYKFHDPIQIQHLFEMEIDFRNKKVIEIGAGGGSFLDLIANIADITAVEIDQKKLNFLKNIKGYKAYSDTKEIPDYCNDYAISFDVIEHTPDPKEFLYEAGRIAKKVIIVTPNRDDILMRILPEYKAFWYKAAHNWYFDIASLGKCASLAGLNVQSIRTFHRFGLSNALLWLRDKTPPGKKELPEITALADKLWKTYLEKEGIGDNIIMYCERKNK